MPLSHENHTFADLEGFDVVSFWYYFRRLFFEDTFLYLFVILLTFWGSLGGSFGVSFWVFFLLRPHGAPKGVLGMQK